MDKVSRRRLSGRFKLPNIDDTFYTLTILSIQTVCVSIDYTLLLSSEIPKFIELSKAYIAKLNGYSKSADCTGIIAE